MSIDRLAKKHFVTVVLFFFFVCFSTPVLAADKIEEDMNALQQMKTEIEKIDTVKEVTIEFGQQGLIYDPSGKTEPFMKNYMAVGVILDQSPASNMEVKIAKIVLENYPLAEKYDILSIQLVPINGMYFNYNDHPDRWKDKVAKMEVDD